MTKEEAKAYFLKIAKEAGVDESTATQQAAIFDNDKLAHAFVARPDVDRAISTEQARYRDIHARNEYLEHEWLPNAKRAEAQANGLIAKFKKYQELYGDIDPNDPADVRRASNATGLSRDEVNALLQETLEQRLSSRDRATLDLMEIREDYMDRFKKRLPMKEFESHVVEARKSGNQDSISAIYRDWISADIEKQTPHRFSEEELKARDRRIAEEATKDFASRHHIPTTTKPREPHLLFDNESLRKSKDGGNGNGNGNGNGPAAGRDAFLEVLNDPDPDTVRSRYPVA